MSLSTNDDVFKFLEFYRNEHIIWNPKDKQHKDKKKVHDAWVRISNEMEIPVPELKKKKEALMATFRQHFKKRKASISSGCGEEDIYKPIWIFYNVMESFLGDVYECSSKMNTWTLNEERSSTDQQIDASQASSEEKQGSSSSNVTMKEGFPFLSNRTVLKRRYSNPPELQRASEQMQNALSTINAVLTNKATQGEDVCDLYGKLLASKLKKYFSDIEQQEVMFELDELLTKRIKNRLTHEQCSTSSLSSGSPYSPASPVQMRRPSSSQTFYVSPDSPLLIPPRPFSSHTYPILHIPEQTNISTQNRIMSSPQHQQLQQPTFDPPGTQVQILSDEVVDSARVNPILREAFFKAEGDK